MFRKYLLIALLTLANTLFGQDFSVYQRLIEAGEIEEVFKSLQYLETQYPKHPFVLYLQALQETDGEIAREKFQNIIDKHPNTYSGELASLKIAEYLYSMGLYTQASELLKLFPDHYANSEHIEHAFNLLRKSFLAIGEEDSIKVYQDKYSLAYPNSSFKNYDYSQDIIDTDATDNSIESDIEEISIDVQDTEEEIRLGDNPWVVQVGAFGERKNADVLANRLRAVGYEIEIVEKIDRSNLYLVQVVRYNSIEKAIDVGEKLLDQFGLEFRVVQRN